MSPAIPVAAFACVWIVGVLALPFIIKGDFPTGARRLMVGASMLAAIGAVLFFLPLLLNAGGLLPGSVEWPVGRATGVVTTASGASVVPHTASGRVQVYDQDLQFIRGWHVEADGGSFELAVAGDDEVVDVYAVRTKLRSRYSLDGLLLSQEPFVGTAAAQAGDQGRSVNIATRWWQWPLTSPAYGFVLAAPGLLLIVVLARRFNGRLPFQIQP